MGNLIDTLTGYNIEFSGLFLDIIIAVVIILAGFILGKIIGRFTGKALHEAEVDKVSKKIGVKISTKHIVSAIIEYLIYIAAITMALNQLKLTKIVLQTVLVAAIILIVIFAFITIGDLIPNLIARFLIYKRKLFNKGDYIETCGVSGKVIGMSLVDVAVITKNKDRIHIPNSTVVRNKIKINKSRR